MGHLHRPSVSQSGSVPEFKLYHSLCLTPIPDRSLLLMSSFCTVCSPMLKLMCFVLELNHMTLSVVINSLPLSYLPALVSSTSYCNPGLSGKAIAPC